MYANPFQTSEINIALIKRHTYLNLSINNDIYNCQKWFKNWQEGVQLPPGVRPHLQWLSTKFLERVKWHSNAAGDVVSEKYIPTTCYILGYKKYPNYLKILIGGQLVHMQVNDYCASYAPLRGTKYLEKSHCLKCEWISYEESVW